MAEDRKFAEGSYVANELDMLSLTSSVYTTPLFQRRFDSVYMPKFVGVGNSQEGPYPGLFISDDFVFPPSEHENLPIESELDELSNNDNGQEGSCGNIDGQEGSCAGNIYEGCNEPAKEVDDRCDENLPVSSDLQPANETTTAVEPPEIHADRVKHNTTCKCDLPCEGWWKRKTTYLSHHIKGMTTVCTIVAAGALTGFFIMGQKWQQDKLHLHHFQFSVSSEGMNRIIGIFSRCKDALPGSQQLRSLLPTRVLPQQQVSA
ncbi:hypothetical protein GUJ93_ZPchr0013g33767 [Zizania palustris]|uniref:ATG8-interacting protein 1 n=1 Tax=Zizania palustris TaxID=103762 RepID=A0A8J6C1L9_ZIZPA|nr:hypothetical protein GUJ93_ZPchr0013g33767 [Zizania palustris]